MGFGEGPDHNSLLYALLPYISAEGNELKIEVEEFSFVKYVVLYEQLVLGEPKKEFYLLSHGVFCYI